MKRRHVFKTSRQPWPWLAVALAAWLLSAPGWAKAAGQEGYFLCGGGLETATWGLWDDVVHDALLSQQWHQRLQDQGDTYALYDVQTHLHNLAAMAGRCQRPERLRQLALFLGKAYHQLEPGPGDSEGTIWLCRGGRICNEKNRLLNQEVMLNSVQFLALAATVANGLMADAQDRPDPFITQTARLAWRHLRRWDTPAAQQQLERQIATQPQDVQDGSSALFFTDAHLWMIALYADLGGLLQRLPSLRVSLGLDDERLVAARRHLNLLMRLFTARVTLIEDQGREGQTVRRADLDRGFWRLYADNKFAAYTSQQPPVACVPQLEGPPRPEPRLTPEELAAIKPVEDVGWDLSHSRRLVHSLAAIDRNRAALREVFGLEEEQIPSTSLSTAFARQLTEKIWDGNANHPLFANFWCGANGWFRVAYDNGTPRCMVGYPPFGLTDAFATGGYTTWSSQAPLLGVLGRRLYALTQSTAATDQAFIGRYYPSLGAKADPLSRALAQIMFWPPLVEASLKDKG